jgi:hypothetical protein
MSGDILASRSTHVGRHRQSAGVKSPAAAAKRLTRPSLRPDMLHASAFAPTVGFAALGAATVAAVTLVGLAQFGDPSGPTRSEALGAPRVSVVETPAGSRLDTQPSRSMTTRTAPAAHRVARASDVTASDVTASHPAGPARTPTRARPVAPRPGHVPAPPHVTPTEPKGGGGTHDGPPPGGDQHRPRPRITLPNPGPITPPLPTLGAATVTPPLPVLGSPTVTLRLGDGSGLLGLL